MGFIGTWLASAIAVGAAIWLVPGIEVVGGTWAAAAFTALFLALVNTLVRPVVSLLSLPFTIITLGLFSLVINAFMLELASYLARNITHTGIVIESFGSAFVAAIVVAVVTMIVGGVVK